MFSRLLFFSATIAMFGVPASLRAQSTSDIEVARASVEADRKAVVAKNMKMTEQESAAFWPVYNDYRNAMRKIGDRRIALIKTYSAQAATLTDQQALDLLKNAQSIASDDLDLKRDYVDKFKKALPPKKVARYYQVESKLDAAANYGAAKNIPLVK